MNTPGNIDNELPPEESPGDSPEESDPTAALQAELDDLKERLLRVSADYQNFARRSQNNVHLARQQQVMDMAKDLLNVVDHFDRALQVGVEKTSAQALLHGLQIVRDELLATLERFGVSGQKVTVGEKFVPGQHEAVMQQAVEGMEPGHVAAILQNGYVLNDKPLRPAKVSVSK